MYLPHPAIKPKSFPYREHVIEGGRRESLDSWESGEESYVVGCAARNPRPLQQIFRDENPVRIAGPPPREIATVRVVPGEQSAPDFGRRRLAHRMYDAQAPT